MVACAVLGQFGGLAGVQAQLLPDPSLAPRRLPTGESPCFSIQRLDILVLSPDQAQRPAPPAQDFSWLRGASAGALADDPPVGQCLGASGVALVVQRAQESLVRRGYVTTRVLAAPQDVSHGALALTVLPGTVDSVRFKDPASNAVRLSNSLPLQSGDLLNLRDIEQGLENLQRVPTAQAQITVEPAMAAAAVAHNDVVVDYRQNAPGRVSLTVDDSGSKGTGKFQGSATVSLDNPLQLSDLFYLTRSHDLGGGAPGPRGTRGYTVHYSLPLHYWTLSATHSGGRYFQQVPGKNQEYIYSGTSENSEIKLGRLIYRDVVRKTRIGLKAWHRGSNNFINDTEVRVQRRSVGGWEFGLNHSDAFGQGSWEGGLAYKRGSGDFDAIAAPEEAFGEGTARFGLVTADLSISAPLGGAAARGVYRLALHVQDNTTQLTPQDRLALGGRYTVRGFDGESSLTGERGWILRSEWGVHLGGAGPEAFVAIDAGEVAGPSTETLPGKALRGGVIGLRGTYRKLHYECFLGAPLYQPTGFRTEEATAGFTMTLSL